MGSTGAGKSTLIDVVLEALTPIASKLLMAGVDIRTNRGVWQRDVGYIPQSIYLVDGTIKQNIVLSLPAESIDVAIERGLRGAHLEKFTATPKSAPKPSSASAASGCPAASASALLSPGHCITIPTFSLWMRRPRHWIT